MIYFTHDSLLELFTWPVFKLRNPMNWQQSLNLHNNEVTFDVTSARNVRDVEAMESEID